MKKHLFYLSFVLSFCLVSLQAFSNEAATNISLTGSIQKGITRSGSTVQPIEAYLTDTGVEACFNKSLGLVTITITNESDIMVYQTVVDSDSEDNWSISMADLPTGTYTINFSCDYGQKTGTFYW